MNFDKIPPVEKYQVYLDIAFRRAQDKGKSLRVLKLQGGRVEKSRYIELLKIQVVVDTIVSRMESIGKSFPNFDDLTEFYKRLVQIHVDYGQLKKSLAAINWLKGAVRRLHKDYVGRIERNRTFDNINPLRREFIGRLSSMVKQVKNDFVFLEQVRRTLKGFPSVKASLRTAAIAGFPNVGKTTLLYYLSGSKGEIATYPFTTKGINVGYIGKGKERIQLLDTPGTLDRFDKMNYIEQTAYLAMECCADLIVYVFDPTEEYPIEKQIQLYKRLKSEMRKEIIIYVSKVDIANPHSVKMLQDKFEVITDYKILAVEIEKKLPMKVKEESEEKEEDMQREDRDEEEI